MARKMIVTLTDDVSGEEIPENGGETVVFALDGKTYELDVTHDNARKLRDTMGAYVKVARMANLGHEKRRGARPTSAAGRTDREESRTIRAWAKRQGMTVPDRGRIPGEVMARWEGLSGTEKALAAQEVKGQQPLDVGVKRTAVDVEALKGTTTPPVNSPPEFSEATTQGKGTKATGKADTPKAPEKQPANA